jgi:Uma2 family endonuclease
MNLPVAEMPLPIRFRPPAPMTDGELLEFSARNEILWIEREADGTIHIKPIPGCAVSLVNMAINCEFAQWADRDGRGEAFLNAGFSLPDGSMRGAYLAWMLNDKWTHLTKHEQAGYAPACPDFVVEIVGPFDELPDLHAKMEQWIANGVQVAWLFDPDDESVTIYRPGEEPEHLVQPTLVQGSGPIAGFELVMARIWE